MKKILVVDDDVQVLESLYRVLSSDGFYVQSADNGIEAIKKIKTESFDLAVINIIMFEMNGIELLKKFSKISPETSAVIITGYPSISTEIKVRNLGAKEYIIKPFTNEEFLHKVRSTLT